MEPMTSNQPSVIDEDAFIVRRTISIAAPIEKVWSAVTDPAHISKWFGQTVLDGSGVGATGTMTFDGHDVIPLRIEAIDEPHLVTYRWGNDDAAAERPSEIGDEATEFTFTLEPDGDGTRLTVVETGFDRTSDPAANMEDHRGGWDGELDKLVALLESSS